MIGLTSDVNFDPMPNQVSILYLEMIDYFNELAAMCGLTHKQDQQTSVQVQVMMWEKKGPCTLYSMTESRFWVDWTTGLDYWTDFEMF